MKCDRCHENPVAVRISQTINGQHQELNLCRECSAELQAGFAKQSWSKLFPDTFFGSWLGGTGGIPSFGAEQAAVQLKCAHCGTSYDDFRRTGLFGCPECYKSFQKNLDQIFLRVQGGTRHTGRRLSGLPAEANPAEQIDELRIRQKEAIEHEDYELAARIRDEIHELEAAVSERGAEA